MVMFESGEY